MAESVDGFLWRGFLRFGGWFGGEGAREARGYCCLQLRIVQVVVVVGGELRKLWRCTRGGGGCCGGTAQKVLELGGAGEYGEVGRSSAGDGLRRCIRRVASWKSIILVREIKKKKKKQV